MHNVFNGSKTETRILCFDYFTEKKDHTRCFIGPSQLVISEEDANFYVFVFGVNGNLRTVCIGAFTVSKQPLGVTIIPIEWATELCQYLQS